MDYAIFRRFPQRPLIYGHRGASAVEPENTMRAFERAFRDGADGVECDVRLTSGGEVIVLHDVDTLRVAGTSVRARTASLADLRRIDVGTGERIPLLADLLDLASARGGLVNVELKGDDVNRAALVRATMQVVRDSKAMKARVLYSTFDVAMFLMLRAARVATAQAAPVGLLLETSSAERFARRGWMKAISPNAVHPPHHALSASFASRIKSTGAVLNVWTVDATADLLRMNELGVDGVVSNDVLHARTVLGPGTVRTSGPVSGG